MFHHLEDRHILIVEDEFLLADDLVQALEKANAQVIGPVATVENARSILSSNETIHAAILDINLQGHMVFDIAEDLKARNIPFIFATGYDQYSIPAAYADVPRWEKPYDTDLLLSEFAKLLA